MPTDERLLVDLPLDLNRVSAADLELVDGIGPTLAARIVEFRRQHGAFRHIADLEEVHGIGAKTLDRVRAQLSVIDDGPPAGLVPLAPSPGRAIRDP